ncbi:ABC transporter permease [Streptacidiphilus sp. EB103A]|uniref:ABC transporter permease n=1 Tax=Streptacidiphilus sp. EB103A TaxID=3156275 RepID=UPI003513F447
MSAVSTEVAGKKPAGKKDDGQDDKASAYAQLSRVMWLLFVRDKAAVFFFLIFPLMFLLLFGTLFKGSTTAHSNIAQIGSIQMLDSVTGADRTQLDKALTITRMTDEAAALRQVKDGKLDGLIEQGPGNTLVLRYSSIDPTKAATVNGILKSVIQTANVEATGKPPTYTLAATQVEDNSVKSIQYLTPGLLGWAVASSGVFSTALTMVLLRRKGVLRRIRLAPMSVTSVVTSRIGISVVMSLTQTAIFLSVATLPFLGLRLTGNWWLVIPLVICATISFMSIGLLIGSVAKSEEAVNGVAQLIVLPMSFLSGSFFSLDGAPGWVKAVSDVMPLRYFVSACENILSRGGGIGDALPTMGGLLLFAAVLTGVSLRLFSWDDV